MVGGVERHRKRPRQWGRKGRKEDRQKRTETGKDTPTLVEEGGFWLFFFFVLPSDLIRRKERHDIVVVFLFSIIAFAFVFPPLPPTLDYHERDIENKNKNGGEATCTKHM